MVGASRVAKAAPDGYTFLFGGLANLAQNQTLYKAPMYNAATDFLPVGLITDLPRVLIARKDFPAKTLPEFIAYAKANPTKLQYGSAGGGSGSHVCALLLDGFIGAKITHVPYRGAGPAMQDLIAGRPRLHGRADFDRVPADRGRHREGDRHDGAESGLGAARSAEREGRRADGFRLRRLGGLGAAA